MSKTIKCKNKCKCKRIINYSEYENFSINNLDLEGRLNVLNYNPDNIKFIINPTEEEQLCSVNIDGHCLQFIDNPSLEVQKAALKNDGYSIQYINNPSEELQLIAIEENANSINLIKNPTKNAILKSILKDPYIIRSYDINIDEELLFRLLPKALGILSYFDVDNFSNELKKFILEQAKYTIMYFKNKEEILLEIYNYKVINYLAEMKYEFSEEFLNSQNYKKYLLEKNI